MKKLFVYICFIILLFGITGCGNTSTKKKIAEYEYSNTFKCEAFNKNIKYFDHYYYYPTDYNKWWIVTEDNDVYVLDTVQEYNSTDGNCKKLNEKFYDIIYVGYNGLREYYNSEYEAVTVNVIENQIEHKNRELRIGKSRIPVLLKNKYTYSVMYDYDKFWTTKGDNHIYEFEIKNIMFTKISGTQDGKLVDIFLIPQDLYDGKLDADFDVKDYITHRYNGNNELLEIAEYTTISVTENFKWTLIQSGHLGNNNKYTYRLSDENINKEYVFDSEVDEYQYAVPIYKLDEKVVFSVEDNEKIIDFINSNDSQNPNDYILTNKSYYRKLLTNPECEKYSEIQCEYNLKKDNELSKIRNDILYRDKDMLILRNGKVYKSNKNENED